jgi:hypothetical protein
MLYGIESNKFFGAKKLISRRNIYYISELKELDEMSTSDREEIIYIYGGGISIGSIYHSQTSFASAIIEV